MNLELIQKDLLFDEGLRQQAYRDSLGHWTIGVGRAFVVNPLSAEETIVVLRDALISKGACIYLLTNDINKTWGKLRDALPWVENLSEPRQRALVNMAFQMGVAGLLQFHNSLHCIESGDWDSAGANLRNSVWYKQTKQRAERIIKLIETGVDP